MQGKEFDAYRESEAGTSTLTLMTPGKVQLSFFGGLSLGRVGVPSICADNGLQVASLDDLMATKVTTLFSRDAWKDRLDIAALLQAGVSLARGIASSQGMCRYAYDPGLILRMLTNFTPDMEQRLGRKNCTVLIKAASKIRTRIVPATITTWELSAAPLPGKDEEDGA